METVASKVPFYQLAVLLDKISSLSGRTVSDRKKQLLRAFVTEWREFHKKLHKLDSNTTDSFFPAMRLLVPHLDRDREAYGIKEHTLAKLYIEILGLGKDSPSAQRLLNYRAPKSGKGDAGDFAGVAYDILQPRCPDRGSMSIEDINTALDEVATGHASKDKTVVHRALGRLLQGLSAREQKWLIRIIMKEMKIGMNQASVLGIFHPDADELYNVKMSLEKVCSMLHDPTVRLNEIEIVIFTPFKPMLGEKSGPNTVEHLMKNRPYFIENKFDGERMQLHKDRDEFKYFSRSGNEYTHVYGNDRNSGNYTPFIAGSFKPHAKSCILDGEMVGFNPESKVIGSKGENFDIKSRGVAAVGYQPMICVFDLLYLNGEVLANQTLRERRRKLADILTPVEGRIMLSDFKEKSTRQDCIDALNDAIDNHEEGIMVKDPESTYKPSTRRGGWYKIKPDYMGGLMDELDVLVVGGNFGVGSRAQMMSHFLCAVAVPAAGDEHPRTFQSFCRVGSGYSQKELFEFNRKLAAHWVPFDKKNPPPWLEFATGLKQRPDAYIEPQHSAILQIKAAEIIASDQYKTGYTLRFPRVEKIRDDKPWYECMTTVELEDLRQKSAGKLAGQYVDQDLDEPKKKRARINKAAVKPSVMTRFRGVDATSVVKVSEMFAGRELCVMCDSETMSKADAERKIIELGGTVVQNPDKDTFCVIADKVSLKVKNIVAKGIYDVVHVNWFLRCIEQQQFLRWVPLDMILTSPKTASQFELDYDCHGDSYYDDTDVDALKKTFMKITEEELEPISNESIAEIEMKYFASDSLYGLFRLCRVYLDDRQESGSCIKESPLQLMAVKLRLHGATVAKSLESDSDVSHVIVDSRDVSRLPWFQNVNRKRRKHFHVVSTDWVTDCIERGKLLMERSYPPTVEHTK